MQASDQQGMVNTSNPPAIRSWPILLWWVFVGLVFFVGLFVRLYDLADPPLDFHPTRQIHSALIARGMLYQQEPGVPEWQRDLALMQWKTEGLIEPQVFERFAAWIYSLIGEPDLRVPRIIAILAWMIGAGFLVRLALMMTGGAGALLAALFFLIWPYGVVASRAFQPEPLVIALIAACLLSAMHWERQDSWKWTVITGLLGGLSIYIKSVAVFFVGPALVCMTLFARGTRALREPKVWVMAALSVVPYMIYHIDGVYLRGYLVAQFSDRFFPQMWLDPAFYLRWISNLSRAVPFEMVLLAAAGVFLIRRTPYRATVLALWIGYFLYGLALPHHISTHDYYHLLLYPAIALGLSGIGETVFSRLSGGWGGRLAVIGIFLAALIVNAYNARTALKRFDGASQAQTWTEIGELLGPGASVAALVPDYGVGLKYWGWINPALWLTVDEIEWRESIGETVDFQSWFDEQAAGKDFFLVTMFEEFENQTQLMNLLYDHYPIYRQSPDYLIFDLRLP